MALTGSSTLCDRLAKELPEGCRFTIHHLSTPPTRSRPIYAASPGERAEETYCESHFLSIAINKDGQILQVFGIEVLIYSTEFLTTLFVSKADSTGYLYLLNLPSGTASPLKSVATTFLQYLVQERRRSDRRLVLSLFARAQNQYLFPGSVENSHKHVLDDRGLIKWWCKVIDPLLGSYQNDSKVLADESRGVPREEHQVRSHGFLIVPGCDKYETQAFLPKIERGRKADNHRWHTTDPLSGLGRSPDLPERCLIPRFPDDPKARFVEQLDDELPDESPEPPRSQPEDLEDSLSKHNVGRWRSVQSMEQFWDQMSYRQECSSGRLVGFLWATFQPAGLIGAEEAVDNEERSRNPSQMTLPTPEISQQQESIPLPPQSPLRSSPAPELPSTPSKGIIAPSQQTPAPTPQKVKEAAIQSQPEETIQYFWPASSRGEVVLRQKDFQRAWNLLLRLDYDNQAAAVESTRTWANDVAEKAGVKTWGREILGTAPITIKPKTKGSEGDSTMLNVRLIRKKKRPIDDLNGHAAETRPEGKEFGVNMLATGLIRKKAKVANGAEPLPAKNPQSTADVKPG